MAYMVRRRTVGRAQDLLNDLTANRANAQFYKDVGEALADLVLYKVLSCWLDLERNNETKVDAKGRKRSSKKR